MGLDTRYIPIEYLQELFRDKDTGLPLSAGKVYFYKDQARTVLKPAYQLTGSPPNYTYAVLPNPLTLSAAGTFQDGSGNDIAVYYFPYDSSGNLELYYVKVESAGAVLQFTREGQPNLKTGEDDTVDIKNNVPNGQFLTHNDIVETPSVDEGEITQAVTEIASGGWTFERPSISTAKDYVTFERFDSPIDNPSSHPRYACRIKTTVADPVDAFKGLRLKYRDVNKFASDTEEYTFSFSGKSNTASDLTVPVILIKNYGTGGDAADTILLQSITLTPTYQTFSITFIFGKNTGKTIGPDNDDFIQLEVALPTSFAYDISTTNFALPKGDVDISLFPIATNAQSLYRAIAGWMPVPDYEGFDLGLPLVRTLSGLKFDDTQIGKIYITNLKNPEIGELLCNGHQYVIAAYSSDGIPYRRLYNKWKEAADDLVIFGPGLTFAIASSGTPPDLVISNLTNGNVTDTADGAVATGFTFVTAQQGTPSLPEISIITPVAVSSIPAGAYFTFHTPTVNTDNFKDFYVWYTKNGVGTDPAVSGYKGIKVNLIPTDTIQQLATKSWKAINGTYFVTPDYRGLFLRGWADGRGTDPDRLARLDRGDTITGDNIGTFQFDIYESHNHQYSYYRKDTYFSVQGGSEPEFWKGETIPTGFTNPSGGNETRPINIYVNYVVKY